MTGISSLGTALQQIELIQSQQIRLSDLSTQLATGQRTQELSGLGTDFLASNRARVDIRTIETYQSNIIQADTRIEQMLRSIEEFQAQAENFADALAGFTAQGGHQRGETVFFDDPLTPEVENIAVGSTSSEPDVDFAALIDLADNLFEFAGDLLNTRQGGRYVFGGAETQEPPFNNNGVLDAAVSTLVTAWKGGTISTEELIADFRDRSATDGNPDALSDSVIGYSAALSSGEVRDVFVRVDDTVEVNYTALANESGFRDVIAALSFFRNENTPPILDAYETTTFPGAPDVNGAPGTTNEEQQDNFFQVFGELSNLVTVALDEIDQTRFRLETARVQISETNERHRQEVALFNNIIADIEEADINEVAIQINALQLNLNASLTITSRIQQLSLVNFI